MRRGPTVAPADSLSLEIFDGLLEVCLEYRACKRTILPCQILYSLNGDVETSNEGHLNEKWFPHPSYILAISHNITQNES